MYADFESITEKISNCQPSDKNHILKLTKSMKLAVLVIKWFVIMTRSIQKMW